MMYSVEEEQEQLRFPLLMTPSQWTTSLPAHEFLQNPLMMSKDSFIEDILLLFRCVRTKATLNSEHEKLALCFEKYFANALFSYPSSVLEQCAHDCLSRSFYLPSQIFSPFDTLQQYFSSYFDFEFQTSILGTYSAVSWTDSKPVHAALKKALMYFYDPKDEMTLPAKSVFIHEILQPARNGLHCFYWLGYPHNSIHRSLSEIFTFVLNLDVRNVPRERLVLWIQHVALCYHAGLGHTERDVCEAGLQLLQAMVPKQQRNLSAFHCFETYLSSILHHKSLSTLCLLAMHCRWYHSSDPKPGKIPATFWPLCKLYSRHMDTQLFLCILWSYGSCFSDDPSIMAQLLREVWLKFHPDEKALGE